MKRLSFDTAESTPFSAIGNGKEEVVKSVKLTRAGLAIRERAQNAIDGPRL